ncbi:hypothetical protein BX600DRAFT_513943 [Xylariales sp. PMI_506]|nr:hypothetical protein BX600DRAFT_513943 [Xylariales sp. PMI_506]
MDAGMNSSTADLCPKVSLMRCVVLLMYDCLLLFSMILSTCLLLYLAVTAYAVPYSSSLGIGAGEITEPAVMVSPCGTTPAEARAAGCQFDMMAFSWLPARCYDAELTAEFARLKDWEYFEDQNRTVPVPLELALTGGYSELYTKFEYHLRHCTFLWKKMHRALLQRGGKRAIDSVTAKYGHTEHCSKMLLGSREVALDLVNSIIQLKFPDCGME